MRALIARLGAAFPLLGADVVEVAPSIGHRGRCPAHQRRGGVIHAGVAGGAGGRAERCDLDAMSGEVTTE